MADPLGEFLDDLIEAEFQTPAGLSNLAALGILALNIAANSVVNAVLAVIEFVGRLFWAVYFAYLEMRARRHHGPRPTDRDLTMRQVDANPTAAAIIFAVVLILCPSSVMVALSVE